MQMNSRNNAVTDTRDSIRHGIFKLAIVHLNMVPHQVKMDGAYVINLSLFLRWEGFPSSNLQ